MTLIIIQLCCDLFLILIHWLDTFYNKNILIFSHFILYLWLLPAFYDVSVLVMLAFSQAGFYVLLESNLFANHFIPLIKLFTIYILLSEYTDMNLNCSCLVKAYNYKPVIMICSSRRLSPIHILVTTTYMNQVSNLKSSPLSSIGLPERLIDCRLDEACSLRAAAILTAKSL